MNPAPIQSCLTNSKSMQLLQRKRKRSQKTVRFDVEHTVIIDTYSSMDYDRGSLFSLPIQYKLNPALYIPKKPTLSLEIPSSPCDSEASSPDIETPTDIPQRRKKPKLTVNTSVCSGGPLFFTKLSTNHVKHTLDDEEDSSNDYLVPITTPLPQSTATFSY